MGLVIRGYITHPASSNFRFRGSNTQLIIKTAINDGILYSRSKLTEFAINLDDNKIIDGHHIIHRMESNWLYIKKTCKTCKFDINTIYKSGTHKEPDYFPPLVLNDESLSYTWKEGRQIDIANYYSSDSITGIQTHITINHRKLSSIPLNFSKFKNLKHLNNRLSTLIVFH